MPTTAQPRHIACMEVWGGHDGFSGCVSIPGNDVFVSCEPHLGHARGGDVYYVSSCAAGLITRFILADVAGHGDAVAALARTLRDLMRRHINTPDQRRFAVAMNRAFAAASTDARFATAVLLSYFADSDHIVVCSAGHPRPLHYSAADRRWQLLDAKAHGAIARGRLAAGPANLPLGIIDPTDYEQFALKLGPGDLVLLYSDALIEAASPGGRALGEPGLLALASSLDPTAPQDLEPALRRAVAAHTGGLRPDDDATIMLLHHNASDPPRSTIVDRALAHARALARR